MYICIYVSISIYVYNMYICTYVYLYICVYVYINISVIYYVFIYMSLIDLYTIIAHVPTSVPQRKRVVWKLCSGCQECPF